MNKNISAYQQACQTLVGGVNSPVRSFQQLQQEPIFMKKGKGSQIFDIENKQYIDYCLSWGALILGHTHPSIVQAVTKALTQGFSFGTATEKEFLFAEKLLQLIKFKGKVRLLNSGTEATMTAIRLARGITSRSKIIKFKGCYHGHSDSFLIEAGSGADFTSQKGKKGVLRETAKQTLSVHYNDIETLNKIFDQYNKEIAAVIIEPIPGNMGVISPQNKFLETLSRLCKNNASLLIFDEVITGFRFKNKTVASLYNIDVDLICLGKIIGGGFPLAALVGKTNWMKNLAPEGDIYQAGTLSGNPIAVTAGLETLSILENPLIYDESEKIMNFFNESMHFLSQKFNFQYQSFGLMWSLFWGLKTPPQSWEDIQKADQKKFASFFKYCSQNNIYLSPAYCESHFLSLVHRRENIEELLNIIEIFSKNNNKT